MCGQGVKCQMCEPLSNLFYFMRLVCIAVRKEHEHQHIRLYFQIFLCSSMCHVCLCNNYPS